MKSDFTQNRKNVFQHFLISALGRSGLGPCRAKRHQVAEGHLSDRQFLSAFQERFEATQQETRFPLNIDALFGFESQKRRNGLFHIDLRFLGRFGRRRLFQFADESPRPVPVADTASGNGIFQSLRRTPFAVTVDPLEVSWTLGADWSSLGTELRTWSIQSCDGGKGSTQPLI
jgi:hypothetical protein